MINFPIFSVFAQLNRNKTFLIFDKTTGYKRSVEHTISRVEWGVNRSFTKTSGFNRKWVTGTKIWDHYWKPRSKNICPEIFRVAELILSLRRVKFNTISTEEQILRDKNRNVFLIDSFTATLYIFGRVPLSFIVHFYLVKVKVPDSIGYVQNKKILSGLKINFAK